MAKQKNQLKLNFMKLKYLYFAISLAFLIPGIISILLFGLEPSIDFTGGSLIELQFEQAVTSDEIRETIPEDIEIGSIQETGENTYLLRSEPISKDENQYIQDSLIASFGPVEEVRFETVGPTLGKELLQKTFTAIAFAAVAIMLYVTTRFNELKYGVSAIIAMFHDSLILLGAFSLLGHFYGVQVDTLFVTALLTTLSFSVHDTIVVYDRIRESLKMHPKASFTDVVNKSVAETLARSVNNSMTIIFMLLALYLLGGESIKWFVFALLIGTISGTYSSTFTAAPLLLVWDKVFKKK